MRKLTPRELELMELVRQGFTNKQIAGQLGISEQTVKNHLSNVYIKLDVTNRITAINTVRTFIIIPLFCISIISFLKTAKVAQEVF